MEYLREKYLKEDKATLVERILILQNANDDLLNLITEIKKELDFKTRELNEVVKELEQ